MCRLQGLSCELPLQQRTYYDQKVKDREYFPGQGKTEMELIGEKLYPFKLGTVIKCNFCAERIDEGLKRGLTPEKTMMRHRPA